MIKEQNRTDFPHSDGFKRYYTWDYYLKKTFSGKVSKLSINGGFTCPNIDGTKGRGGCIYCSSSGSGDFSAPADHSIPRQIERMKASMKSKWDTDKFIAYFQAHTNTYAPVDKLRELYDSALSCDNIVGLSVSTRPDCIDEDIADLLASYKDKTHLTVELGLQSVSDSTAEFINRCHTYNDFLKGFSLLRERGIRICVHIINGLPGEDRSMMMDTAREMARIRPDIIKIHLMHVLKNTRLAQIYEQGGLTPLSLEEYISIVCDQLEILPPDIIIERVTGDGAKDDLIAPLWSLKKFVVINEIDKELLRRDSHQGKKYSSVI